MRLASRGWDGVRVDFSPVRLAKGRLPAKMLGIEVNWLARQVDTASGIVVALDALVLAVRPHLRVPLHLGDHGIPHACEPLGGGRGQLSKHRSSHERPRIRDR